jgi:hypothetical protein
VGAEDQEYDRPRGARFEGGGDVITPLKGIR